MAVDPALLDRLSHGDEAAVGELIAQYGPYLRAVARGQLSDRLRTKFDSSDVVQSVWVQVVKKLQAGTMHCGSEPELRSLLVTMTRRRVISRVRQVASAADAETPITAATEGLLSDGQPRPSEVAQADDVWDQIVQLCPPEHQSVIQLRRQGLTSEEIAERTGFHEGSVRRILRQIGRKLATSGRRIPIPDQFRAPPE